MVGFDQLGPVAAKVSPSTERSFGPLAPPEPDFVRPSGKWVAK